MELRLNKVGYRYGRGKMVIKDIDLVLDEPGLICIIGPNGVGKSTLVKCINHISNPTEGEIFIDGVDISTMKRSEIAKKIGYVPSATEDCFSMPVIDTILVGRYNHYRFKPGKKDLDIVRRAMSILDLNELAMRGFNELSAGQHQKVSIARGLVTETDYLILDEPTSNLDVRHQIYVTELLRAIATDQKKIIIMICHDLNIAAKYANKVVVMSAPGVIYEVGTPKEVFTPEMLREVYGVDCDVVVENDVPFIKLGFALPPESWSKSNGTSVPEEDS